MLLLRPLLLLPLRCSMNEKGSLGAENHGYVPGSYEADWKKPKRRAIIRFAYAYNNNERLISNL